VTLQCSVSGRSRLPPLSAAPCFPSATACFAVPSRNCRASIRCNREGRFFQRVLKYSLLKALSYRLPYSLFAASCKLLRTTHDRIISDAVRGFAGGDLLRKMRYQPSYALLALLERRLRRYTPEHLRPRMDAARLASSFLPGISIMGRHARNHSHWVFPIRSKQPDRLVRRLWGEGFDGTRGASSLYAVPAAGGSGTDAAEARRMIDHVVYLPVDSGARVADLRRLAEAVLRFEAADPDCRAKRALSDQSGAGTRSKAAST
jgi:perosamine synthetase